MSRSSYWKCSEACEFCEIFKKTYLVDHLRTAASEYLEKQNLLPRIFTKIIRSEL